MSRELAKRGHDVSIVTERRGSQGEIENITNRMNSNDYTIFDVKDPFSAGRILGGACMVLGLRLHSLILSAMLEVPIMSVDYDSKIKGFMEHVGAGGYLLKPDDLPEKYLETINKLLNNSEIRLNLLSTVASIRERILTQARTMREILVIH